MALAGLFTLPGWWVINPRDQPSAQKLHQLRRRIKRARYGLHNLTALAPQAFQPWVDQLKATQTVLGDLQDLQVLVHTLERLLEAAPDSVMPCLCSLILEAQDQAWQRWLLLAADLRTLEGRQGLLKLQLKA